MSVAPTPSSDAASRLSPPPPIAVLATADDDDVAPSTPPPLASARKAPSKPAQSNQKTKDKEKPKEKEKRKPKPARVAGQPPFPLPRVQKIMKSDNELSSASKEAVFVMALGTEAFIKFLAKAGASESTRRRGLSVAYKDMASAVQEKDELNFLQETIPQAIPLSAALARRLAKQKEDIADEASTSTTNGADRRSSLHKGKGKGRQSNGKANGRKRSGSESDDGRWSGEVIFPDGQATRWMHTRQSQGGQPGIPAPLTTTMPMTGLQWQHHHMASAPPGSTPGSEVGEGGAPPPTWNGQYPPTQHRFHPHPHPHGAPPPPPPDGRWPAAPAVYHPAAGRTIYSANSHPPPSAPPSSNHGPPTTYVEPRSAGSAEASSK